MDGLAGAWKKDGFGARAEAEAGEKGKKAELVALVYELAMGEGVDKADGLSVA